MYLVLYPPLLFMLPSLMSQIIDRSKNHFLKPYIMPRILIYFIKFAVIYGYKLGVS
jgi:hypothetical protein